MTVGLYLMTGKGEAVLEAALASVVEIAHVTYAPARGMNDLAHERIPARCKALGIPTFLRNPPPSYLGDWSIAAGWRWMLPPERLIVLHDSLLPRYRGFSPLITALVNGEPQIGVSAFLAEEEPDTGPIVAQRAIPVSYPARMSDVLARVAPLYREIAEEVCVTLAAGEQPRAAAQDHRLATYSIWRDHHDFRIDWTSDDRRICRLVDAASAPFPGAWTTLNDKLVRVHIADVAADVRFEDRHPGKVAFVHDAPVVVCGTGMVRLIEVRDERGEHVPIGLKSRLR